MTALLYFEEKVHRKKLQRADTILVLFLRLLCHILEHMGYPTEIHLKCRQHCRERFTLDKWTQLEGYAPHIATPAPAASQDEQAQQDDPPTEIVPPAPVAPTTVPMPETTTIAPPTTSATPSAALLHQRPLSPFLPQSFVPWCIYFKLLPPRTMLYSGRWRRCMHN